MINSVKKIDDYDVLLWDYNETIVGERHPNETNSSEPVILPGVKEAMAKAKLSVIIAGTKTVESEAQNFDAEKITQRFTNLMHQLPIYAAAFSPTIGGVECYVVLKRGNTISIIKAHEDPKYLKLIGDFKKPGVGMFVVMKDIISTYFGRNITKDNSIMIGDAWQDEEAAKSFGINFIDAKYIHSKGKNL